MVTIKSMAVKKVLVTGAGRGIGLATARAFASAGWRVVSLDKEFSSDVVGERLDFDLRRSADIRPMVASLGELDTLVNNAAVLYCDPLDEIPDQHRREILAVNLEAPAALIAAVAPGMKTRREGRIVNVSSVAAFTGHPDLWYGVTKGRVTESHKNLGTRTRPVWSSGECASSRADADAHVRPASPIAP